MMKIIKIITFFIIFSFTNLSAQNYDYENWSGKNNISKSNVSLNNKLISKYNLLIEKGSTNKVLFYKYYMNNDSIKKYKIIIRIFITSKEAQEALVKYLDAISNIKKPFFLTTEDYKVGDVAFGEEYNGILYLYFVRNNIIVHIESPIVIATNIAKEVDDIIQNASDCSEGLEPVLIY